MVKLISIPVIILIYATVIIYLNRNKNYNLIFKRAIFNSLIIPLIFVFSISNIFLSDNQMATIGFKKSELELGLFSMALFIVCIIVAYQNLYIDTFIALSYVWTIFVIMINICCLRLIFNNKMSFNNYYILLLISIISTLYVIYYSYKSKFSKQIRNP